MSAAALTVEVAANFARFASDMNKVASIAEDNAKKIEKVFGVVSTGLKAIGAGTAVGLSLDAIKNKIEGAIEAAAGLKELSERTGATVEGLSTLTETAKLSGTGTDELATGLQKLSKAMVDAQGGGQKTTAAFNAIGISTRDLKGLKPDEAFELISKALAGYADGAEKTAIAQALFGKAGANLLPVMNDLAVAGDYVYKTTDKQAEAALEYEKNLKRLNIVTDSVSRQIGFAVLPVLDAFAKAMLKSATSADGLGAKVGELAKDGSLRDWAEGAAKVVGFVVDAFDGVVRVVKIVGLALGAMAATAAALVSNDSVSGKLAAIKSIQKEYIADREKILQQEQFSVKLNRELAAARADAAKPQKGDEPRKQIHFNPNEGKDDPNKAIFDGVLRQEDAFIAAEATLLRTREGQLDYFRGLDYLTLRDVEERKQTLIANSLTQTLAAYDREAAANVIAIARAKTETQKQELANKGADIAKKREAAEVAANTAITASVERLDAVQRQFDLGTAEVARQAEKSNDAAKFQIDLLGRNTLEVLKANEARKIDLALEERIFQLRKQDPTADVSQAVAQAEQQKAAALALVEESYEKQRSAAFGAQEAFRKYAEDAANTGAQVENMLSNAFKGAEDALVEFVKTGKLNFKSLADSIITDIIRMQVKAALGTGGSTGGGLLGLIGAAAGLFGGSGGLSTADYSSSGFATAPGSDYSHEGAHLASGTNYVPYDGMRAVLHKGEAVVPAAYNPASGGGARVTINNYSGADVQSKTDDAGHVEIIVQRAAKLGADMAHARVLGEIAGGGAAHRVIANQYGLSRSNGAPQRA